MTKAPSSSSSAGLGRLSILVSLSLLLPILVSSCKRSGDSVILTSEATDDGSSGEGPARPFDDDDQDGLTNLEEFEGWDVAVDETGYGTDALTVRRVTSDPLRPDSDGDGLSDGEERAIRSDPRLADTDGDGLTDDEEWRRWLTNPNSVDTDGDARKEGGPPNPALFDGNELTGSRTSPTLADTDGDGRTDLEELDDPVRSPLIADLPRAEIEIVGGIDMRLNVEYEESKGQDQEYGTTVGSESSETTGSSHSHSVGAAFEWGFEHESGGSFFGPNAKFKTSFSATFSTEHTWEFSKERTESISEEYSRYTTDSTSQTESFASGTIRAGLVLKNPGLFSFEVRDLAVTVLRLEPEGADGPDSFKTLATLLPDVSGTVLSPGERTDPILVSSSDVNPDLMKEFLANPSSLVFRPSFNVVSQDGIDFDFLNERTYSRTALVEIDTGDPDGDGISEVESYRVATNVARVTGGGYEGISMRDVMTEVLGLRALEEPGARGYTTREDLDAEGRPTGRRVLDSINGHRSVDRPDSFPESLWLVRVSPAEGNPVGSVPSFDEITLRGGDEIRLMYNVDRDDDGVFERVEDFFGSDDSPVDGGEDTKDTDADGLDDRLETVLGWTAGLDSETGEPIAALKPFGYPKQVFSDPRIADSDRDGLTDAEELAKGSDPRHPDTDRDTIPDGVDLCPIHPAGILHVDPRSPVNGSGLAMDWSDAMHDLKTAIDKANELNSDRNEQNELDCRNDIAQIWVARGTYRPSGFNPSFVLPDRVGVYGGFLGGLDGETKQGQRNPDPFTNGTVLSGDLNADDSRGAAPEGQNRNSRGDNAEHVVRVDSGQRSVLLDGFTITGGDASLRGGGLLIGPSGALLDVTLRNLLFIDNVAGYWNEGGGQGGAIAIDDLRQDDYFPEAAPHLTVSIQDSTFVGNRATFGGAISDQFMLDNDDSGTGVHFTITRCRFEDNVADGLDGRPGDGADRFSERRRGFGGAVFLANADVTRCVFSRNYAKLEGSAIFNRFGAANARLPGGAAVLNVSHSRFTGNIAGKYGGAVSTGHVNHTHQVGFSTRAGEGRSNFVTCAFYENRADQGEGIDVQDSQGLENDHAQLELRTRTLRQSATFMQSPSWRDYVNDQDQAGAILNRGQMNLVNCTVARNVSWWFAGGDRTSWVGGIAHLVPLDNGTGFLNLANCIVWDNHREALNVGHGQLEGDQIRQLFEDNSGLPRGSRSEAIAVRYSCVMDMGIGDFAPGFDREPTNIDPAWDTSKEGEEPVFKDMLSGDLSLKPDSPCLDVGNSFVDIDLFTSGFQFLTSQDLPWYPGPFDLRGAPRIADGDRDGDAVVDMGALESQAEQ
ncbi:MAG: hypothetical protein RL885_02710 [Planctomycetota bacterium]